MWSGVTTWNRKECVEMSGRTQLKLENKDRRIRYHRRLATAAGDYLIDTSAYKYL